MDEPQLILLKANKTSVVALAIPSGNLKQALFIATTATQKNWQAYLDGEVDLRYLFAYADVRSTYHFDLMRMKDSRVVMDPWRGNIDEKYLPNPRFFSRNHTEDDENLNPSIDQEKLYVDGEWDIPDFGKFYNRYSNIYYFLTSTSEVEDISSSADLKKIY